MAQPWKTLDSIATEQGRLELRQRGERDFLITLGGLVLMNSLAHRSEAALGRLACARLAGRPRPRVLVGGLGMGYTLRAVLDQLPADAEVLVAELNPVVVAWCRGPLAPLTDAAADDPRVRIEITDVAVRLRGAARGQERFDAVVLDLYTGPDADCHPHRDPLYGSRAIATARAALKRGGIFAVWGESHDAGFEARLRAAGFSVSCHRPGRGGLRHVVYLAETGAGEMSRPAGSATAPKQIPAKKGSTRGKKTELRIRKTSERAGQESQKGGKAAAPAGRKK